MTDIYDLDEPYDDEPVEQLPKYWLPDGVYDVLKWVALVACPLVAAIYPWLAEVWGLPLGQEVSDTATIAGLAIGVAIGVSQLSASRGAKGGGRGATLAAVAVAVAAALAAPQGAYAYTQREDIVSYGHGSNAAQYLVIHETANPGASAYNHTLLWSRDDTYAVHYVMELDGSVVYHTMPDWALAYHVGNGNYSTVGIELAHATTTSDFNAQWREAVKWAGDYLASRGWGTDRLLSHNECRYIWGGTDHTDPDGYFRSNGKSWSEFESAVASYMASGAVPSGGSSSGGGDLPDAPSKVTEKVDVQYAMRVRGGGWLDEVENYNNTNSEGFAGLPYCAHDLLYIKVDEGKVKYRVCTAEDGWLAYVTKGDPADTVNGCAGIPGHTITGVEIYYTTPSGEEYKQAWYRSQTAYRAGYLDTCCDDGTTYAGYDGWAGWPGEPMDRLQIAICDADPY